MLILLVALASVQAPAATPDSTRLSGIVRSSISGRPLSGVLVALHSAKTFRVTDSTGVFDLGPVPVGHRVLTFAFGEYPSVEHEIELAAARPVRLVVLLDVEGEDLAPIIVDADAPNYGLSLAGFYVRRAKGFGRFVTQEEIATRNPPALSGMLAGTGVRVGCRRGVCVPTRVGSRACPLAVFLDGVWVREFDLDWVPPDDVAGIEIYKGAQVPTEFARHAGDCGAVLVWTRRG
jgi:hypothetical protein